jgi:hypothetical protein
LPLVKFYQPRSRRDGRQAPHPQADPQAYPQLVAADMDEALAYAAWRLEESLVLSC